MTGATEVILSTTLIIGGAFILVGSYGLLKLDSPMSRLHAPTKASTLGVGSILAASVIHAFSRGEPSVHELLIMAFLFVTAPVSALFIAKVAIHRGRIAQEPPPPPEDSTWATRDNREETKGDGDESLVP